MLLGVVLAVALALEPPAAPTARVNDYAGLLSAGERERLDQLIETRERATGAQVAIAIFRSLDGGNVEDFSIRLAERWRIGQKGLDNGVILLVFVEDRKVRLEVGYGLEAVIPDIVAGRIIGEVIAPSFRERRYAAGLEAAVQAVYRHVEEGPKTPARRTPTGSIPVAGFIVLMIVIAVVLGIEARRSKRFVGRRGYTAGRQGWSGPVILPGPRWGGGWGGGLGRGGFSGGGGRFGGGGASGSW